jgi:membrane-associated protein
MRESKTLNAFFISALQQYGYPALWLIVFVAAVGAPISGNLLLYAAGAFVAFGDFNIFILFPVALSAAVLGDNLGYFIGRGVGTPLLSWLESQKRFQFISPRTLTRGREYFRRKTAWAIFISRFFIVALGGPINLLAGIEQYPFRKFLFWDISGQILGAAIPLTLGYIFAESWEEVAGILGAFSGFFLALLTAIFLTFLLVRKIHQRRVSTAPKFEENNSLHRIERIIEQDTSPLPITE